MILYKYRSLERLDYILDIILNERLYCSYYKDLNDPLEGIYASVFSSTIFGINMKSKTYKELDGENCPARICSLSSTFSDIRMWSHYADGHKGIAIEIDSNDIKNTWEVKYVKELLGFSQTFLSSLWIKQEGLKNKTFHWEYEKEYRIIGKEKYFDISNKIKAVYCGIRTPEKSINILRKVIPSSIPVFTTNLNKETLEVEKSKEISFKKDSFT